MSTKRFRLAGLAIIVSCLLQPLSAQEEIRKDAGYYFRTEGYALPVLSPGGNYTFTRYRKPTGRYAVVVFDLKTGEAKSFGFGEEEDLRSVRWLDEDNLLVYFGNVDQQLFGAYGVFRYQVSEGKRTMVVGYVSDILGLPVSRPGHAWLSYNTLQKMRLVEVDAFGRVNATEMYEKQSMVRTVRVPEDTKGFLLQADGEVRFVVERESQEKPSVLHWRADLESDQWQVVPVNWDAYDYIGVDAGGRGLLVASYGDSAFKGLYHLDAENGKLGRNLFRNEAHGLDDSAVPLYGRGSNAIKGMRYLTDRVTTVWFDQNFVALQGYVDTQLKGRWNRIQDWTADGTNFLIHSTSPDQPARLFRLDLKNRRMSDLTGRIPWQQAPVHFATERLAFKSRAGHELEAYLTKPRASQAGEKFPLVVVVEDSIGDRDTLEFNAMAQWLAANGYACLRVNARNASGQSRALSEALRYDLAGAGRDHVDATEAALADGAIDASRIGIIGLGIGAYSALVAVVDRPQLFKASLAYEGFLDATDYLTDRFKFGNPVEYQQIKELIAKRPELAQAYFGTPSEDMLKQVKTPMLLVVPQGIPVGVHRSLWPAYPWFESEAAKFQRMYRRLGGSVAIERLKPVKRTDDLVPIRMEEVKGFLQKML